MERLILYNKEGNPVRDMDGGDVIIDNISYDDTWMGECFITIDIMSSSPVDFSIGDYVMYRGERFEVNYDPGKIKTSSRLSAGDAFKYESVKLNSLADELVRCDFLDLVINDNELHYTSLPRFQFYAQSIDDLLDRIQANLDKLYGKSLWKIYSPDLEKSKNRGCDVSVWNNTYNESMTITDFDSKSLVIQDKNCWEGLSLVNSEFDINFIVRDRNVFVGTEGIIADKIFQYGKGNGLYELEQNADSDQQIVTRLRAYGSEKNMPSLAYRNIGKNIFCNILGVWKYSSGDGEIMIDLPLDEIYFRNPRTITYNKDTGKEVEEQKGQYVLTVTLDHKIYAKCYIYKKDDWTRLRFHYGNSDPNFGDTYDNSTDSKIDNINYILDLAKNGDRIYIEKGVYKEQIPIRFVEMAADLPNNMSINRLMLPGFPHKSLKQWWEENTNKHSWLYSGTKEHIFSEEPLLPYIESMNVNEIGVRPASVFFETDNKKDGIIEIYPTIEEMVVDGVRIDEIDSGTTVEDDGYFDDSIKNIPNVTVRLKSKINFDINECTYENFTLAMKDGMCGGREFPIVRCDHLSNGQWELELKRVQDSALELWFPYKDYQINKGDHFVFLNIEMPDEYVEAASEKLLKYSLMYLDENDRTRYTYTPKVDEIFMARQHDESIADPSGVMKSLYMTLKAGDIMIIKDEDLGIDTEMTIDKLSIKESEGNIPQYDITLREERQVSTISKIQDKIDSIVTGSGTSGYISNENIKNIVDIEGSKRFLSKVNPDEALGLIKFRKGIEAEKAKINKDIEATSAKITKDILATSGDFTNFHTDNAVIDEGLDINGPINSASDFIKILKKIISSDGVQFGDNFAEGIPGIGGLINGEGRGFLRSLELYESLSVPELNYNRVNINVGFDWRASGGGVIEDVSIDVDENGEYLTTGTITLKLEDGEIGSVMADDLCLGIFHNIDGSNDAETTDDYKGLYSFAGFSTCYFRITEILDTNYNSKFKFVLRNDGKWTAKTYPKASMRFVCFGNPTNEKRQSSEYSTTKYTRFLRNVTTWEYRIENIGMQFGDLENLMVYGVDMKGYSVFAQNMYLTGHIAGVDSNDCELVISGINDTITVGENRKIDMKLMSKGYEVSDALFDISRDSGDADADATWNEGHKGLASTIYLSSDDMGEGGYVNPVMFIFTGTSQKDSAITSSTGKVIRLVTQEQMYITFYSNKGKSLQVYYDNVDIAIEARLMYGEEDITDSLVINKSDTQVVWTRDSGNINTDKAWIPTIGDKKNILLIEDKVNGRHDCGDSWQTSLQTTFKCEITVNIGNSVMKMSADLNVGI